MSIAEIVLSFLGLLQIIAVCFVPKIWGLFKSVADLEKQDIALAGRINTMEAELKAMVKETQLNVEHLNGNLKQGMEYIRHTMDEMKTSIAGIQNEMHEFFKHGRRTGD